MKNVPAKIAKKLAECENEIMKMVITDKITTENFYEHPTFGAKLMQFLNYTQFAVEIGYPAEETNAFAWMKDFQENKMIPVKDAINVSENVEKRAETAKG